MLKRRSNEDILQFIRDLPGGNVPQYAKLLNTTAIRISALLHTKEGEKLARANKVKAAEKGMLPTWSFTEERGSLRGRDVADMVRDGRLPPFIAKMLDTIHPNYREDALEFLRESLDQTSNHRSFEEQITSYMEHTKHYTDEIGSSRAIIAARDAEIARFDYVIAQANRMAGLLEHQTAAQQAAIEPVGETAELQGSESQSGEGSANTQPEAAEAL